MAITTFGVEDKIELVGPSVVGKLTSGAGEAIEVPLSKFAMGLENSVTGAVITSIWTGTQAQYDALPVKASSTLHLIVG